MSVELNKRIASLMGWLQEDEDAWVDRDDERHIVGFMTYANFNPTGCENSAGLVQNRIAALGWMTTIYTGPYKNQGIKCRCCIMRGPQDFVLGGVDVVDNTRSMAISKAFVEAMERWGDE